MKRLLLVLALFVCCQSLLAHAIWIETPAVGKPGEPQEVKVFLGEYAGNERDSISHWFSNMKDFTLWLTTPDGKKTQLSCTPAGYFFKATFTPGAVGSYLLSIDHTVQEVYSGTKIHYYATGLVNVPKVQAGFNTAGATDFGIAADPAKALKVNKPASVNLLYKQAAPAAGELTVQSPEGWTKTIKADEKGAVSFIPAWGGRYLLEGVFVEAATGQHEGKEFKRVRHVVTYCTDIQK